MSISHLLLIAIVALVLFGPNKLPELGRALGKTIREFKKTANDLMGDLNDSEPQQPPRKDVTPPPVTQVSEPVAAAPAQQDKPPADSRRLPD
ncbi:twin-arginine translocase TatA/TatE family subunit [Paenibacillus sp. NPDC056579]|uniref:Sec-independent protein translocase subunit TatA/TatB n=1 Tax=unclassified Paenibacillus TaxID=185978 RepID=UPI001EF82B09|nr:twin-arginine translocase TatA/TatE family subunit [Paenibacillus sp. H1-7]ULL19049.1 twin-arginine translocase TatA/TatE family subunit [Paenibacillus sp. H1-7]